jgi:hypothetical protein
MEMFGSDKMEPWGLTNPCPKCGKGAPAQGGMAEGKVILFIVWWCSHCRTVFITDTLTAHLRWLAHGGSHEKKEK